MEYLIGISRIEVFDSRVIIATVVARPLPGLQKNPPEIDLFFPRADDIEIDPTQGLNGREPSSY